MKRKQIGIWAISIIVIGLMISVSATSVVQTSEDIKEIKINWNVATEHSISAEATTIEKQVIINENSNNALPIPLFEGMHPTIAAGGSSVMIGFDDLEGEGTWFSASPDGGQSWTDGLGWDFGMTEFPSVSYWAGSRFIGTMTPDYSTSGQVILVDFVDATNPETWLGAAWDWEDYDFYDFENINFEAHDGSLEEYRLGFWTFNGYVGYDVYDLDNAPICQYTVGEDSATISWFLVENCVKPASDMDREGQMHYSIWQMYNESTAINDIFFRMDTADYNMDDGSDTLGGTITIGENIENMDICAEDDMVIIVGESDGDIIAIYSTDGFDTFDATLVVSGASSPRISEIGDNEAVCSFVKDGNLYISNTQNSGATWSTPSLVSDGPVYDDYHESDISEGGAIYTGTDDIIYIEPEVGAVRPIITIDSVSGGMGVKVNVKNIGTGDGVDIPYSITATGGILGMIDKNTEGTISINAGSSGTVSLPMIIGLGAVNIEINVGTASETISGTQLLVYTKI
ncbi:MAG: hypothetical protein DRN27_01375 [Thermoplasmata archaeon]|nr:MAG: hypothetical protein DRN27_01375 [Thermoplasmata archaeon]